MATKMSAEEKAVRDALAAVQADTGVQQATSILNTGGSTQSKPASLGGISDITDPAWRSLLERLSSTTTNLETTVVKKAADLGYSVNTSTGALTPITPNNNSNQQNAGNLPKSQLPANVAYDTISALLESYGITGLASELQKIRQEYPEANSADLMTLLQFDPRYNAKFNERFSANAERQKAGLPVLSPATYLQMEQGYKKAFAQYNLNAFNNQAYYNKLIAGDVAVTELSDRITLAYDRVMNDTSINKAFKEFYPSLTTTDIVTGMLDPVNQYPALERKVKAAEIGGAALRQGLSASELATTPETSKAYSNVTSATLGADVLAQQGITKAEAQAGYANIAAELPTAEKLSSIYGNQLSQYGRLEAEQAQFQGLASAKRAKERLVATEIGTFSGTSGRYQGKSSASQQI